MADQVSSPPSPGVPPAPAVPPPSPAPETEKPSRFRFVTVVFVLLIVATFVYLDQFTSVDLRLLNYRLTPDELGRKVTFVNISPLSDVIAASGEEAATKLLATIYTKIGHKAVQAAGRLDLALKDAHGNVLEAWKDIQLPPQGSGVEWGGFPLGGWHVSLPLQQVPTTPETYLDVTYVNPANKAFPARAPVQTVSGR